MKEKRYIRKITVKIGPQNKSIEKKSIQLLS